MRFILSAILVYFPAAGQAGDFYLELAVHHSPIIYQETGFNSKGDQITRVDFDGDFVSQNNWNNLKKYPTPASVYYDVIESESHYFITYAFFHPRDYMFICLRGGCHENDMEGVMMVVRKFDAWAYGKLEYMETIAHGRAVGTKTPDFVNTHPMVKSRKGGHAVYPWNGELSERFYIYWCGGTSEDPGKSKDGIYSYDLISLQELWDRRDQVGTKMLWGNTFTYVGRRFTLEKIPKALAGFKKGKFKANPPWAWVGGKDDLLGDWFLDPAWTMKMRLGAGDDFSLTYLWHPYLR